MFDSNYEHDDFTSTKSARAELRRRWMHLKSRNRVYKCESINKSHENARMKIPRLVVEELLAQT